MTSYSDYQIKAVCQLQICRNATENRLVSNGEDPTLQGLTPCHHEQLHGRNAEGHPSNLQYFLLGSILEAAEGKLQVKLQRGPSLHF